MKKLTIFETSIIGFLVGAVVAAYLAFAVGTDGFVGTVLSWVALVPVAHMIVDQQGTSLVVPFVSTLLAFTVYGALAGLVLQRYPKAGIMTMVVVSLVVAGGAYEQVRGSIAHVPAAVDQVYTAALIDLKPKAPVAPIQYFGTEALGDLNGDGLDDIAFLIMRDDEDRGLLHYLVAALAFEGGKAGTNLIFVGERLSPTRLSIQDGFIALEYEDYAVRDQIATSTLYAQVVNGVLKKTDAPIVVTGEATTTQSTEGM